MGVRSCWLLLDGHGDVMGTSFAPYTSMRSRHRGVTAYSLENPALATIPEESPSGSDCSDSSDGESSSSASDGPNSCADNSSVPFRPQEMRYHGSGLFIRADSLDYYGDVNGAARWGRATLAVP